MNVIKYGDLKKCFQEDGVRAKCKSCGTKVSLSLIEASNDWKCPLCENKNKVLTIKEKIGNTWSTIKDIAKILATPIAFPIYILVFIIAGVIGFARDTWENVDDIATAIGYILGILLCIGIVCAIIGVIVASFKLGYMTVMNY